MHLDKYSNAGEALKNENGLAVLGYLIDVSVLFIRHPLTDFEIRHICQPVIDA